MQFFKSILKAKLFDENNNKDQVIELPTPMGMSTSPGGGYIQNARQIERRYHYVTGLIMFIFVSN